MRDRRRIEVMRRLLEPGMWDVQYSGREPILGKTWPTVKRTCTETILREQVRDLVLLGENK